MQPVLSGVSQQIRTATLEANCEQSAELVEQADREFSDRIADQEGSDRVDVGESLEAVDSLVPQEIIDEAKLDAWQSYLHPDLIDVGATDYSYPALFVPSSLEAMLVGNDTLAVAGITFTSVRELDINLTESEYTDAIEFEETIDRLGCSGLDVPNSTTGQNSPS